MKTILLSAITTITILALIASALSLASIPSYVLCYARASSMPQEHVQSFRVNLLGACQVKVHGSWLNATGLKFVKHETEL